MTNTIITALAFLFFIHGRFLLTLLAKGQLRNQENFQRHVRTRLQITPGRIHIAEADIWAIADLVH